MSRHLGAAKWKLDVDYWRALAPEERAWLSKFTCEYYGCMFKGEPLHNTEELRKSVFEATNAGRRDVVNNCSSGKVDFTPATYAFANRYYSPDDYCQTSKGDEDARIFEIDLANAAVELAERPRGRKRIPRWYRRRGVLETAC
jgi:hypothetical protein